MLAAEVIGVREQRERRSVTLTFQGRGESEAGIDAPGKFKMRSVEGNGLPRSGTLGLHKQKQTIL
jgi:hypothetical protein